MPTSSSLRSAPPAPEPEVSVSSDYARALELAGLMWRAPLRRRRLAVGVFLLGAVVTLATALLKARVGDEVTVRTPRGPERLDVTDIRYGTADQG